MEVVAICVAQALCIVRMNLESYGQRTEKFKEIFQVIPVRIINNLW